MNEILHYHSSKDYENKLQGWPAMLAAMIADVEWISQHSHGTYSYSDHVIPQGYRRTYRFSHQEDAVLFKLVRYG
jgi:hypothetical protein